MSTLSWWTTNKSDLGNQGRSSDLLSRHTQAGGRKPKTRSGEDFGRICHQSAGWMFSPHRGILVYHIIHPFHSTVEWFLVNLQSSCVIINNVLITSSLSVTFPHFPNLFTCSSKSNPQMYLSHHILFLKYFIYLLIWLCWVLAVAM